MTFPLAEPRRVQYLRRLGFGGAPPVDVEGLRALHVANLRTFPFENLDIHLGRPIVLDGHAIAAKLLDEGRGGYCYELNSAFGSLLIALGFDVDLLEARVYSDGDHGDGDDPGDGADPDAPDDPDDGSGRTVGIRFDHACLLVRVDGEERLADVGFGACFQDPIPVTPGVDQPDPNGTYRLDERSDGWLDLTEDGEPRYRLALTPRSLPDFAEGNHHQQTSPGSPFTRNTICSLATPDGRVTVRGWQLIETVGDDRAETELTPDQFGPTLAERFGIELTDAELARLQPAS